MTTTATGRLRPQSTEETKLNATVLAEQLGHRKHVEIAIPQTSVTGRMRLVTRGELSDIRTDARAHLKTRGYPIDTVVAGLATVDEWNAEVAVRHLAIAVRDPADVARPLASLDEWRECTDDQIGYLWERYKDLAEELDPMTAPTLTEEEVTALQSAAKKSEAAAGLALLLAFGSRKLATFIRTSVGQPASSPTQRS
jgi:hypothetical protein